MQYNRHGYPRKKWIKSVIEKRGLDPDLVTLSAGYEDGLNCGILWRREDAKIALLDLHIDFEEHGWSIKAVKYYGRIHSVWIQKIEIRK